MTVDADIMVARKGGNMKVSIPEDTEDSDIEPRNTDGMLSVFIFVYATLQKYINYRSTAMDQKL